MYRICAREHVLVLARCLQVKKKNACFVCVVLPALYVPEITLVMHTTISVP
jgi:hypothetical protein